MKSAPLGPNYDLPKCVDSRIAEIRRFMDGETCLEGAIPRFRAPTTACQGFNTVCLIHRFAFVLSSGDMLSQIELLAYLNVVARR